MTDTSPPPDSPAIIARAAKLMSDAEKTPGVTIVDRDTAEAYFLARAASRIAWEGRK